MHGSTARDLTSPPPSQLRNEAVQSRVTGIGSRGYARNRDALRPITSTVPGILLLPVYRVVCLASPPPSHRREGAMSSGRSPRMRTGVRVATYRRKKARAPAGRRPRRGVLQGTRGQQMGRGERRVGGAAPEIGPAGAPRRPPQRASSSHVAVAATTQPRADGRAHCSETAAARAEAEAGVLVPHARRATVAWQTAAVPSAPAPPRQGAST